MRDTRKKLPPMNALRAFAAAGRRLNFRAASEDLGVSQGAVAQQIRLLEDHLGQALFIRLPRGVALTSRGAAYHAEVKRAFDILLDATDQISDADDSLTISVTPTFATRLLIQSLPSLNALLPDVNIRTIATVAITDFDRDQVDISVRETCPPFSPEHEAQLLFRQDFIIVGSPHLLKNEASALTPDSLRSMPLLHDSYGHWQKYFDIENRLLGPVFNQISLAIDAALAGQGLAIVSRAFVQADLKAGRLIDVGPAGEVPERNYYLVRKKSQRPRAMSDTVWSWCLKTFSQ
ncbi:MULTISPECIES: LysR substrate-binding domain-containing protein [Pacificibacter]|uniref:LysR substrate-binding domain-containing protein n=1 Tax=Pacificibacter TaxID=1042323 RepID=UPI001C0A28CE|nr:MULTISPECIES: LysR substrate-binding domain-containing protein [Pacificibacter]MBU2937021.1 LysR family transcriptional regulator [Pacificibacter marinus]MDO6616439.1 LysR substrate-binding domain-containing protein [Pacificibacter sp. 1_MG-2023]